MTIDRRKLLQGTAATLAAGALVGPFRAGRALAQAAPKFTPEEGASLRLLRWVPFVAGEEEAWNANTAAFTAATGVKVKTLGDLPACVGVLKSLITNQEDLGQALNAGLATAVGAEIIEGLKMNFAGECTEVGMYLAMSRQADREGFPEVAEAYKRIAFEEAEHAAKFAELLGEVVTDSTKKNLEMRVDAENGATAGKFELAKLAKAQNLDAIHDTVHEMARDEARHGKAFAGLLKRYFGE